MRFYFKFALLWFFFLAPMLGVTLMYGQTQPSSPSNAPKLNGSNETLTKWESISGKFQSELTALQQDLQTALNDANQSKVSLQKSIALYETSLKRTQNLENYNQQIAERMQERDEDLAQAYTKIDRLEKVLRRVIIACAVFACLFVLSIALRYFRLI